MRVASMPSSRKLFCDTLPAFAERDAIRLEVWTTPGANSVRRVKSRPFSGKSVTRRVSMVLLISGLALIFSMVLGIFIALGRLSKLRVVSFASATYVEVFRDTPVLVQLFWVYYVLPILLGIRIDAAFHPVQRGVGQIHAMLPPSQIHRLMCQNPQTIGRVSVRVGLGRQLIGVQIVALRQTREAKIMGFPTGQIGQLRSRPEHRPAQRIVGE